MNVSILGGTDTVVYNLDLNQQIETSTVSQLASGLRVQNAADDPSGYAISQTLQSRVTGLQQAASNVQNANNALTVASSALTTVQDILQRVRSLVVESRSDLNSNAQLQNIQSEINQMLLEVNQIGQNTNFNGQNLLNGTFDTSTASAGTVTQVASPILTPSGAAAGSNVVDENGTGGNDPGPLVTSVSPPQPGYSGVPGLFVVSVIGYSANAVDPDSGANVGAADYVQVQVYSQSNAIGPAPEYTDISAVPVDSGPILGTQIYDGYYLLQAGINFANLTSLDVGTSIAFEISGATSGGSGQALSVNDGGQEGTTIGVSLPTISAAQLQISDISVLRPNQLEIVPGSGNTPYVAGQDSSNNLASYDAEFRVDSAIQTIGNAQAQIGAQMVALNETASNDNTAVVNFQAAQSSITDLNVGQATTQYSREQILNQVGTSVLSQMQIHAQQLMQTLFANL